MLCVYCHPVAVKDQAYGKVNVLPLIKDEAKKPYLYTGAPPLDRPQRQREREKEREIEQ